MAWSTHFPTQAEIAPLFAGAADPDWETDRDLIDQTLRDPWDTPHLREGGLLADRLLALGQDTAPRLRQPFRSADHGDLLYDERGLLADVVGGAFQDAEGALVADLGEGARG